MKHIRRWLANLLVDMDAYDRLLEEHQELQRQIGVYKRHTATLNWQCVKLELERARWASTKVAARPMPEIVVKPWHPTHASLLSSPTPATIDSATLQVMTRIMDVLKAEGPKQTHELAASLEDGQRGLLVSALIEFCRQGSIVGIRCARPSPRMWAAVDKDPFPEGPFNAN